MKKISSILFVLVLHFSFAQELDLMPYPKSVTLLEGQFPINSETKFVLTGTHSVNTPAYFNRMIHRLSNRTSVLFKTVAITANTTSKNVIEVHSTKKIDLKFNEDENYSISITKDKVSIKGSEVGCYRALETLLQLICVEKEHYVLPTVQIQDNPRFPWRGLMIDACRHFMPVEVIKRNIDAMATAKMNVFHWHLTEDQAFRIESKTYPKLHLEGNDGEYYTQQEVKDVVLYAKARGIRVVPEFDIPGHATSWCVAYPEFCSKKQEYVLEEKYGIFDPTLDPSKEETYVFLNGFLSEMAALFPDQYMHIGGDENKGKHWDDNATIQQFKKENKLTSNHELQAYFNQRVLAILRANGKKMVGWDEIYHKSIPNEIVIQSWRGKKSLYEVAKAGYPGMLSNGYYLDLVYSAEEYYLNDPLPKNNDLNEAQKQLIYGGEATMWSELVSEETIDSRIWPVTLAIAERFWSPQEVTNVDNMYKRLKIASLQLEEHGLTHLKNQGMLFSRLCHNQKYEKALLFVQLLEPLKGYQRHQYIEFKTHYPLSRLADVCYTESMEAREFQKLVENYKKGKADKEDVISRLHSFKEAAEEYIVLSKKAPGMIEGVALANDLQNACNWMLSILIETGVDKQKVLDRLNILRKTKMDCQLVVLDSFEYLIKE